jgi:hypothetical protein
MWRLLLSGLLCLPALVLLVVELEDRSVPGSRAVDSPAAGIAAPHAAMPTLQLWLPPVQLSTGPGLPDLGSWEPAGLVVTIPMQQVASEAIPFVPLIEPSRVALPARTDVAMRHRSSDRAGHRGSRFDVATRFEHRAPASGIVIAFISRNLTERAFALPNQNGGG